MGQLTLALACEATDATDANPHLIELAAVVVRDGLITGEQFHALIKPPVPEALQLARLWLALGAPMRSSG